MNTETEDRRSTQTPVVGRTERGAAICTHGRQYSICGECWPSETKQRVHDFHPRSGYCQICGYHKGACESAICSGGPNEQHIDTSDEFDQTRQHAHIPASLCPVADCKEWPTVANARLVKGHLALGPTPAANCQNCGFGGGKHPSWCADQPGPRHVSPAIHEFRIKELEEKLAFTEKEMDRLDSEATKYRVENVELRNRICQFEQRIAGFERINERLANAVDEWLANATSEHKAAA